MRIRSGSVVVALALTLWGCEWLEKQQEKRRAAQKAAKAAKPSLPEGNKLTDNVAPPVPGDGIAAGDEYRIAHLSVRVEEKNWDDGGAPDPKITITANGEEIGTCTRQDSYVVACNPQADFELRPDTRIKLAVVDRDVAFDDKIGSASITGLTKAGALGIELPLRTQGGVQTARLRIIKKPGFFADHKYRFYGLLGGVAGALLIALMFGRYLFDERHYLVGGASARAETESMTDAVAEGVVEVVKVRCPFCGGLCGEADTTCEHCGGKL